MKRPRRHSQVAGSPMRGGTSSTKSSATCSDALRFALQYINRWAPSRSVDGIEFLVGRCVGCLCWYSSSSLVGFLEAHQTEEPGSNSHCLALFFLPFGIEGTTVCERADSRRKLATRRTWPLSAKNRNELDRMVRSPARRRRRRGRSHREIVGCRTVWLAAENLLPY